MDALYRDYILDHYKNPRNFGTLEPHDLEHHDHNPLCGDEMGVHIRVEDGKIADLRFHGQGCAISQASASIASEELIGMEVGRDRRPRRRMDLRPAGDRHLPHPPQVRAAQPEGHARRHHRRRVLAGVAAASSRTTVATAATIAVAPRSTVAVISSERIAAPSASAITGFTYA